MRVPCCRIANAEWMTFDSCVTPLLMCCAMNCMNRANVLPCRVQVNFGRFRRYSSHRFSPSRCRCIRRFAVLRRCTARCPEIAADCCRIPELAVQTAVQTAVSARTAILAHAMKVEGGSGRNAEDGMAAEPGASVQRSKSLRSMFKRRSIFCIATRVRPHSSAAREMLPFVRSRMRWRNCRWKRSSSCCLASS